MQIDHAGENCVGVLQLDDVGCPRILRLNAGIDFNNLAIANNDAGVATPHVANAIEQPAATNNQLCTS